MNPRISIITTTFNSERYLAEAIESVLSQTMPDFEYIIYDDGSNDASLDIALSYALQDKRIRVFRGEHAGHPPALGRAIIQCRATYFGQVDSDDRLYPSALARVFEALEGHPNAGMIYTHYENIDKNGTVFYKEHSRNKVAYSASDLLCIFMTFHFRMIHRGAYHAIGGIDTSYQAAADYDLCLKLSEQFEIVELPEILYQYRIHLDSVSQTKTHIQTECCNRAIYEAMERRGLSKEWKVVFPENSKIPMFVKKEEETILFNRTHTVSF
jgi:glycosyltransferase involved in cell wall biosynthesis